MTQLTGHARTARVLLLVTALLFSTGGAAIKATTLTNWQLACARSAIACVVLWLASGRRARFTAPVLFVGLAQAATLMSFVAANKLTTAANAVFFQGSAPLYIALIGPLWLHERLSRRDYPVLGAIVIGILLLFAGPEAPSATAPNRLLGNVIGAFSGACWAMTVMGLRWLARRDPATPSALSATVAGNLIACVASAPLVFPIGDVGAGDLAIVLYLGVFQVGLAYLLLGRSLSRVPAVDAALILLAEPAFSPLWAWLVHGELPGGWPLAGGMLIVGSTTWKTWRDARTTADT